MRIIKKLDQYIFKNFISLFAGTFCISLFAVMMQFLWKYVDEKDIPVIWNILKEVDEFLAKKFIEEGDN
jgi:hypothetical protein